MSYMIPFPQADDIQKIFVIINLSDESVLKDNEQLGIVLGNITERQVSYYLAAARYLGIINLSGNKRQYSDFGLKLRMMNSTKQEMEIISKILIDAAFNKVYIYWSMYGEQDIEDVENIIRELHPEYSDAIYHRRAQTVISWVKWINKKLTS